MISEKIGSAVIFLRPEKNPIQWISVNRYQFLQPKKSLLTENPLYPNLFMHCYVVNGFPIKIPIDRKSPLSESRLTEIHCI